MHALRRIPSYVWAFIALVGGITAGGLLPDLLAPVASGTQVGISWLIRLVPLLIFAAVSPAIATLVRRGLAGRFVGALIGWYVLTSVAAGLLGVVIASVLFGIPFTSSTTGALAQGAEILRDLGSSRGASLPMLAIVGAVLVGLIGVKSDSLYAILRRVERGITRLGGSIGHIMVPLVLAFGIMIGVTFGASLGMSHYGGMIAYALFMSLIWWSFYVFVLLRLLGGVRSPGRLLKQYYVPTALFAAGTCSSLATIPINLASIKKYGVRDDVADFTIPFGAVVNQDAAAMQFTAYAAFLGAHVFGLEVTWSLLLVAWPVIVLYTIASPGVPGAMASSLWAAVFFASVLGLEDPLRATFVGTWVALAAGVPDMFRTATNATGDGFTTIIFSHKFEKYFAQDQTHELAGSSIPTLADGPDAGRSAGS